MFSTAAARRARSRARRRAGSSTARAPRPRATARGALVAIASSAAASVSSIVGPMLPATATRRPAALDQQRGQRGGGRLAVGAGDGQHLRRVAALGLQVGQRAREQVELALHGDAAARAPRRSSGAMRASCGARPGLFSTSCTPSARRRASAPPNSGAAAASAPAPRPAAAARASPTRAPARRGARTSAPSPGRSRRGRARAPVEAVQVLHRHRSFRLARPTRHSSIVMIQKRIDDLRLVPAALLEVVVQRRHLAGCAGPCRSCCLVYLNQPTCTITDSASTTKMPPMIAEHDLLARDDGDGAERAAERQRADVAHEDLRRVGVEPQEGQARAGHRGAEDQQLAGAGDVREQQVLASRPSCRST